MTADKPTRYVRKTDEEIATLAKRVYRNEIFMSWNIENNADLPLVFLPISFFEKEAVQQLVDDGIGYFYEEYDKALPRSVNGYPCFGSMHVLSEEDGLRIAKRVAEIIELVEGKV